MVDMMGMVLIVTVMLLCLHARKLWEMYLNHRAWVWARLYVHLMYLWWSLCPLYLHACQVRVTVDYMYI